MKTYDNLLKNEQCDAEIDKMLERVINSVDNKGQYLIEPKPHKRVDKNTPKYIELNLKFY
ncbi:hypothetical protein [uncultured Algoriphagus sp.]|uniref:hypothetical protein n=1 Tax=uncultured Algoriphagus sp. TaxID=417365 RepID=UPI0030EB1917|tara:strand:- start:3020 stop:3199 length:180 start_codon:yes stop_codon:yes gene_type:complete